METIGGQAVIEGVLIKSKKWIVTAVRNPKGKIIFRKKRNKSLSKKKIFSLPLIRGIIVLIETLAEGYSALDYSARIAGEDEHKKVSAFYIILSLVLALAFAILIFKVLPLAFVQFLNTKVELFKNRLVFNLSEGLLKIMILVGYIALISMMKEIRRVFQYHGAEHKAVHCYEKEGCLSLANSIKYSTSHPRCGTSFLLYVITISILVYALLPMEMPFWQKAVWRLLLLPFIAGLAYEIIKISARFPNSAFFKALTWPGMFLQKMTTREPDKKQLEVALFAAKKAIG